MPVLARAPLTTERAIVAVRARAASPEARNPSVPADLASLLAEGFGDHAEAAGEPHLTLTPDDSDPPHDPPPIPGMVGPSLLGATPATFELPASGGSQAIAGGIDGGDGDGFFPSGTLLVSRNK